MADAEQRNRFQDFFEEGNYTVLKNHLYNYLLRRRAIENMLAREPHDLILEVGSGISPVMTRTSRIVYSELSFLACRTLREIHGRGAYVVADATRLPFRAEAFSHAISSEVLEHVADDAAAVQELARVVRPGGRLLVSFPNRKCYFANDDRYVKHYRRYELSEMSARLNEAGLRAIEVRKVLGPLDKLTMMFAVRFFDMTQQLRPDAEPSARPSIWVRAAEPFFVWVNRLYAIVVWLDAAVMPRALATCLLIKAEKR